MSEIKAQPAYQSNAYLQSSTLQVCHIVLGLRPATPEEEGQIIRYAIVTIFFFFFCHSYFQQYFTEYVFWFVGDGWNERAGMVSKLDIIGFLSLCSGGNNGRNMSNM